MSAPPPVDPDLPLIRRAQQGDLQAFDEIVFRHQSTLSALLHRFTRNRSDLEDMLQESFLHAWRGLPGWRPDKPFLHWLKRIAVRCGLEFCRRESRSPLNRQVSPGADGADALDKIAADTTHAGDHLSALGEAQFLLSHLPAEDRALLTLLHLEEMPLAEIAGHFGWSRINAKVKAHRARSRLKSILKRHGYEIN